MALPKQVRTLDKVDLLRALDRCNRPYLRVSPGARFGSLPLWLMGPLTGIVLSPLSTAPSPRLGFTSGKLYLGDKGFFPHLGSPQDATRHCKHPAFGNESTKSQKLYARVGGFTTSHSVETRFRAFISGCCLPCSWLKSPTQKEATKSPYGPCEYLT